MGWKTTAHGVMFYVPEDQPPRFRCSVIVRHADGENTICGEPFWDEAPYVRHVTGCARKHADVIEAAAPRNTKPAWLTQQNVTDWEDWLDETDTAGESNRSKVIAKRKKL